MDFKVDYLPYDGWLEQFCQFKERLNIDYLISGNQYLSDETVIY